MDILLTGSNGFLGAILYKRLKNHFSIYRLSRNNADFNIDLSLKVPLFSKKFDLVIHAAGKAHFIPKTILDSTIFFDNNVRGTENLLKALENGNLPQYFIFISSVSVYGLTEGTMIDENSPLKATDPYGKSKIEAEKLILDWCKKHNVVCSILRLPLIADINAPGNLSAMIDAISGGYYFNIAGGFAKKSMVLPTDISKYIPLVAKVGGIYNLTDGYNPSFLELSSLIASKVGKKKVFNIPYWLAKAIAYCGDIIGEKFPINSLKLTKICTSLTFDDTLAKKTFGWNPTPVLKEL